MQKDAAITEDDLKALENDTQKLTDESIKLIDKMTADKEKEIMEV
jgi:ribosome recycling factor